MDYIFALYTIVYIIQHKPFNIYTTDGFVIYMLEQYLKNKNDSEILKNILEDSNGLRNCSKEGDTFVLGRGFRNIVCTLQEKMFKVSVPTLKGERMQLTAEEYK